MSGLVNHHFRVFSLRSCAFSFCHLVEPFEFADQILWVIAIHLCISGRYQEADGSCIILHSLCSIQGDSFTNLLPCFLLISIEIMEHGGGRTPQARILRLAFSDDLIGKGDEVEGFFLVDDLGANFLNPFLVYLVLERLSIVC